MGRRKQFRGVDSSGEKVKKLEKGKYISVLTKTGGKEGTTSILSYSDKKLTDF